MNAGPKPYQPRVIPPTKKLVGEPRTDKHRPWLALRRGESAREWHVRISHTCAFCGHYEDDLEVLDRHETEHAEGRTDA